jgi:hypothetical protein
VGPRTEALSARGPIRVHGTQDQQPTTATAVPLGPVKETALLSLRDLAKSLDARGFTVRLDPDNWTLIARNEAATADDDTPTNGRPDPLAVAYGQVKLMQRVTLPVQPRSACHAPALYRQLGMVRRLHRLESYGSAQGRGASRRCRRQSSRVR